MNERYEEVTVSISIEHAAKATELLELLKTIGGDDTFGTKMMVLLSLAIWPELRSDTTPAEVAATVQKLIDERVWTGDIQP